MAKVQLNDIARLASSADNVAIATHRIEPDTFIEGPKGQFKIQHTILEGHRFVLIPIGSGEPLLSWALPFGTAIRDLFPGEYVCNEKILIALGQRNIDFDLPHKPNFLDVMVEHQIDATSFSPGQQVPRNSEIETFFGYRRSGRRGVGTRNFIVILAVTVKSAAFARQIESKYSSQNLGENIDGVIAVTHTEGDGTLPPNNFSLVMRTLAGFMVHPNVGAVQVVDYGDGTFTAGDLKQFVLDNDYPLEHTLHEFFRIEGSSDRGLIDAIKTIDQWIPIVGKQVRTEESIENISLALQCGGSDAFSGISGNPLAGSVAKEVIRRGGKANLAETDELIGAESYVLSNVKDLPTAQLFLQKIKNFKQYAANHGASAEGNPSGGNNFRGLYNIALKSIGAARKKDPEVRLDAVIDYGALMADSGYYFMDSPGNDLESIAGQVASGCNMILFITGNGSITNFPFVPTLKFVTTTGRFEMLSNEMDVNAGRYNDGESMESLTHETFALTTRVASGEKSKGELAGHSQVQLWRNWQQSSSLETRHTNSISTPVGPIDVGAGNKRNLSFSGYELENGVTSDNVGLIMPTSLCSGQVAQLIANKLNVARENEPVLARVNRYIALVHTEGCGSANAEELFLNIVSGHLQHPFITHAVLLEHGCERTHNDAIRHDLLSKGLNPTRFDWASVQLDGGLDRVAKKVETQFRVALDSPVQRKTGSIADLKIGLMTQGSISEITARALAGLIRDLVVSGSTIVVPENASIVDSTVFMERLLTDEQSWSVNLDYGAHPSSNGCFVMATPTTSTTEILTGLGGTGVEIILMYTNGMPVASHPLVPVLQFSDQNEYSDKFFDDLDFVLPQLMDKPSDFLMTKIEHTITRRHIPKLHHRGYSNFQVTRGTVGVSL
ncbi:MAG TPA: altronate hydrolase [Gammaproteobacteria bacterium]|nr:altronate hydrolase [Gammaproteobacteria bacterium]